MTRSLYINRWRYLPLQIFYKKNSRLMYIFCAMFAAIIPAWNTYFIVKVIFWKYIKSTRVLLVYLPKWNGYDKADVTVTNWTNAAMLQIISSVFPSCAHNKRIFSINLDSIKIYVNSPNLIKRNIKIDQYVYICLFCKQFLLENS